MTNQADVLEIIKIFLNESVFLTMKTYCRFYSLFNWRSQMVTSSQKKLEKIRKPRVHLTYDLHLGDTTVRKELPFVVGVLANLYGHNDNNKLFKDRRFTLIDKGNFEKFMEEVAPKLAFSVKDKSSADENTKIAVELFFKSMNDFSPDNFIKQSDSVGPLLTKRKMLLEMLAKLDGNGALLTLLLETLKDSSKTKELAEAA